MTLENMLSRASRSVRLITTVIVLDAVSMFPIGKLSMQVTVVTTVTRKTIVLSKLRSSCLARLICRTTIVLSSMARACVLNSY